MITYQLPWPPSENQYRRHIPGRRAPIMSRDARQYRRRVESIVLERGTEVFTGRLAVDVMAHPPDRRRRDLDNLLKGLLDSLEAAGVFRDDGQIDDLRIRRGELDIGAAVGGCVVVTIEEVRHDDTN